MVEIFIMWSKITAEKIKNEFKKLKGRVVTNISKKSFKTAEYHQYLKRKDYNTVYLQQIG